MSSKSDRDNRANQLNPNNSAYASSREGSSRFDDDDIPSAFKSRGHHHQGQLPRSRPPVMSDVIYYISAVTFEGDAILGYFTVRAERSHSLIAESMRSKILALLGDMSKLGVAYWRCASGWERGCFKWHDPKVKQSDLQSASRWMDSKELARAHAWFATSQSRAHEFEKWFDWRRTEHLIDFGVVSRELPPTLSKHDYVEIRPYAQSKQLVEAMTG